MSRDRIIQLQENAEELGFRTIQEALDNGYNEVQDLVNGTFKLEKVDEQEEAHEAWLRERDEVLSIIESVKEDIVELNGGNNEHVAIDELNRVIDFVEGCHD